MIKNKKYMYMMFIAIIVLLGIIIVPTYAKFTHTYTTDNNIVGIDLDFELSITDIEEYQEITVPAGNMIQFNVSVENNTDATAYYGIWYKMVNPGAMPSDGSIEIGRLADTTTSTSGSIPTNDSITSSIGIINSTNNEIKVYIGVNSSVSSVNDIEYLDGKYLISGEVSGIYDIMITSITIDGTVSNSLPTSGTYTMTSSCTKAGDNTLGWEPLSKTITYSGGAQTGDKCILTFTSSTNYPLLNTMEVGSYVAYTGTGGTVGSTSVACQDDDSLSSSSTAADATEAPHPCKGQNAREDLDTSEYTYGYCYSSNYRYYTTGWRIAYIKDNKAVLVSAGSPECLSRTSSSANATYIKTANANALKYCNTSYVDGSCTCEDSDSDGLCDTASTDAWAINDYDFYYMTKAISGYGKRLADDSNAADDSLGDTGGTLSDTYCNNKYSYKECGYNNDLIDNGGYYWFASRYTSSSTSSYYTYGMHWYPYYRSVNYNSTTNAYGLRPVISLSSSVYVTGGDGTMDNPYQISNGATSQLLSEASVGSYVEYVGNNGCTGTHCSGANANSGSNSNGHCSHNDIGTIYEFNSSGWRIAYTSDGSAYLISGGAPECVSTTAEGTTTYTDTRSSSTSRLTAGNMGYIFYTSYTLDSSTGVYSVSGASEFDWDKEYDMISDYGTLYTCAGSTTCEILYELYDYENETAAIVYTHTATATTTSGGAVESSLHISNLNNKALTYCNTAYSAGGVCDSTTAWASNETDYYNITGYYLSDTSCFGSSATCSINNEYLIKNGSYYWFSTAKSTNYIYIWDTYYNVISNRDSSFSLGLRPIIKLDSSVVITGGTGTADNPYTIAKQ